MNKETKENILDAGEKSIEDEDDGIFINFINALPEVGIDVQTYCDIEEHFAQMNEHLDPYWYYGEVVIPFLETIAPPEGSE